ncbi:MAG: hypothetical protein F4110_11145 [Acidimicrobiaceae bacterium]|nr:hypothetical protein [Acidimicrobiaceae bacterium]MYE95994.1 hypothetical protein [Acidimicrobiaceae bacterium]MYI54521.1 hypothetical protein [Acidimicrobiaceae bacterium]
MRLARRAAAALLSALVAWPAVAVAQDADTGAEPEPATGAEAEAEAPAARVACDDAPTVFELLCHSYRMLKDDFVDEPADEDLAAAAAEGVREAGLATRGAGAAPPCALPSPAFEQTCAEIDAVDDAAAAVWAASNAMFASLGDPNTFLMSPAEYAQMQARLNTGLKYSGIGLRLGLLNGTVACSVLSETCRLVVSEVFPGSPAEEAGLRPDDVLLLIAGLAPSGSGCGLPALPAFELGSLVPVVVERNGRRRTFRMEAAPVSAPAVASRTVAGTIGYLRLESFGTGADERVGEELETLLDSGAESIVVDLRGNPGGYLQTVINIAGMFLDDRQVVIREESRLDTLRHLVSGHGSLPNPARLPTAVAVDGSSASASEVLALALRDHGRATVVGATTYGKNTGQVTQPVESRDGALLGGARVTVFRWFGPDGASAEGGVEPDVELDLSDCWHPIGFTRLAAAAAGLPGALPADVQMDGESFDAVAALAEDGVLAGAECGPGLLCPGDPIPRWLLAVWLVRVLDGQDPAPVSTSRFADVDAGRWWAAHAERLAELGITVGCGAEPARYCPDDPVTRAQAASFLKRAFRFAPAPPAGFSDTHGNHHAAAIDALHAAGITKGCSAEVLEFCPERATTRIQMALFLERARNRSKLSPA